MRLNGFGKDIWAVEEQNITELLQVSRPLVQLQACARVKTILRPPPLDFCLQELLITSIHQGCYVAALIYVGARSFTQVSIMLFYLHVFTVKEVRRKIVYTLIL